MRLSFDRVQIVGQLNHIAGAAAAKVRPLVADGGYDGVATFLQVLALLALELGNCGVEVCLCPLPHEQPAVAHVAGALQVELRSVEFFPPSP